MDKTEGEMENFLKVWLSVFVSLCYCFMVGKITSKGRTRLLCVLPVVSLFLVLPLILVTVNLGGMTSFFITWLANFKLLLFAFGKGPLCSDPSISFGSFLAVACLPIEIQQNPPPKPPENAENLYPKDQNKKYPSPQKPKKGQKSPLNYAVKTILLALLIRVYNHSDYIVKIHPTLLLVLYCFHIYFSLEIVLAMMAILARTLLSFELEPQFNEPYLSSSLQDFWGRRWNIMVTSILRPTVYEPVLKVSSHFLGRNYAPLPAVLGTFVVSGLMHELIFYYLGRVWPTWEITWFFLLHGFCLMAEIALKKAINGHFRLPRAVSGPLTVGFVMVTGFWLFFPPLLRCGADERAIAEYAVVGAFARDVGRAITFRLYK